MQMRPVYSELFGDIDLPSELREDLTARRNIMKKDLFLKSGISLLILAGSSMGPASATSFEGSLYSDLATLQESQQWTTSTARGAEGPIRSVDVQPAANDIYESISKYQAAQQFNMSPSERGAQGPVRSEAEMTMERNQQEWKKMVGIFYGS